MFPVELNQQQHLFQEDEIMLLKRSWYNLKFWAKKLNKQFPHTNLIGLSDEKLGQMLLSLKQAKGMPPLPNDDVYFYSLKCIWVEIQYGDEGSDDIPDAYI